VVNLQKKYNQKIKWIDEIFIVDSFSTDKTLEICRQYDNVKIVQNEYENSGAQRYWGMPQVTHDWIFIIDSDERCNKYLRREIENILSLHSSYTLSNDRKYGTFFFGLSGGRPLMRYHFFIFRRATVYMFDLRQKLHAEECATLSCQKM